MRVQMFILKRNNRPTLSYSQKQVTRCCPPCETESTTYSVPWRNSWTRTAPLSAPKTLRPPRIVSKAVRASDSEEAKYTPSDPAEARGLRTAWIGVGVSWLVSQAGRQRHESHQSVSQSTTPVSQAATHLELALGVVRLELAEEGEGLIPAVVAWSVGRVDV